MQIFYCKIPVYIYKLRFPTLKYAQPQPLKYSTNINTFDFMQEVINICTYLGIVQNLKQVIYSTKMTSNKKA